MHKLKNHLFLCGILLPAAGRCFAGDDESPLHTMPEFVILVIRMMAVFMPWFFLPMFLFSTVKLIHAKGRGGCLWPAVIVSGTVSGFFFHWLFAELQSTM